MENGSDSIHELTDRVLTAAQNGRTGTLVVTAAGGDTRLILFQKGSIADVDTGREDTLLEAALLESGRFSEKDIRAAQKRAQKQQTTLGSALIESGAVPDDVVEQCIRQRLTEEVCEVFTWRLESCEFLEHAESERVDGFFSDLGSYYEILAEPEEIVIEAASRLERWELVRQHFPILRDVYYATPSSFKYFRDQAKYPAEYEIIQHVDGTRDVAEVVAAAGTDPFAALLLFRRLQSAGDVELINPVQMYQLGVDHLAASKFDKATKLFERAWERGLDDFDLQLKLAQSLEGAGRKAEAFERYLDFGEKCVAQSRYDDALRCLKKATTIAPDVLVARERYLKVLLEQSHLPEAAEETLTIVRMLSEQGDMRRALDLLTRVRSLIPKEIRLQHKIIELSELCGDSATARRERELLAKSCDERKDLEAALEAYQRMFCEGNDSLEVRLKLVELHKGKGNKQKALEHIGAVLNLPEKRRPQDEQTMVSLHETVRQLRPSDVRSNRWLADYHSRKGSPAKAAEILTTWIANLEREGNLYEVVHAYERLILIDDRHEHRWGFAQVLFKLGREADAIRELRSMANLALRRRDFTEAQKALDQITKSAPLDIEARKLLAEMFEAQERLEAAARKHEEVARLSIYSGNAHEAELYCRRLDGSRPRVAEIIHDLGRLCLENGDQQKAVEQFLKAGRLHLQNRNLGLCRRAIDEVMSVEPGQKEATALVAELQAQERPAVTPAVSVPPQPQPSSCDPPAPAPQVAYVASSAPPPSTGGLFEPAPPVRTSVSNITAKLRKLKSAGLPPARDAAAPAAEKPADAPAPQGSSKALRSAAARLKALGARKPGGTDAEAGPAPAAETSPSAEVPPPSATRDDPDPPAPPPASAPVESSAPSESRPEPEAPPAAAEVSEDTEIIGASSVAMQAASPSEADPPAPTPEAGEPAADAAARARLSRSASRLAALRKRPVVTE